MTNFEVGDIVRKPSGTRPTGFLLNTGKSETAVVERIENGRIFVADHRYPAQGGGYPPSKLVLVARAPKPTTKGIFIAVKLDKAGQPMLFEGNPRFDTQDAAEKEAARAAKFVPGETFGVLHLIGKVNMQPTWVR